MTKEIPLFYWSEKRFIFKEKENYGDLLSKYLVEKISGREVKWVHPRKQPWYKPEKKNYLAVGSILHHATKQSIVWGSGIIDQKQIITDAHYKAVRGPFSRNIILKAGFKCPENYGDPALLLPLYFKTPIEKEWKLGIIPHYHDYDTISKLYKDEEDIRVIDVMTNDIEEVTSIILACQYTISSSLHGLIVSHAYDIPSLWVQFSDKLFGDGIKFKDYFASVELGYYKVIINNKRSIKSLLTLFKEYPVKPDRQKITELQKSLLSSCPFHKQS